MRLRDTPIRRKLIFLMMLMSVVVMLLMRGVFFTYELRELRRNLVQQLSTLAGILAANSTAALAFDNEQDAATVLSSLQTLPHVTAAGLYDQGGRLFAQYPEHLDAEVLPAVPAAAGHAYTGNRLFVTQPVDYAGRRLGTLVVTFDTGPLVREWLWNSLKVGATVMGVVFLIAYLLSRALQRQISEPISALAQTARTVSEKGDYAVRATRFGDDETGRLTDAFNHMLARIQTQNRALLESETKLRTIIENLSEGLVVSDLQGEEIQFNRAALHLHGFTSPGEGPLNLTRFAEGFELAALDGTLLAPAERPLARVLRGEDLRNLELRIHHRAAGWRRVFNYGGTLVRDARGEPMMAVVTIADITERKQAEEEIRRFNLSLEERVSERTAQLEEANRELEAFSYSVSHDLRAPLRHVQGYAEMLSRNLGDQLSDKARRYLKVIDQASIDMGRLIDDLLSFSRMGRTRMNTDAVDVNALVDHVRTSLELAMRGRRIVWVVPELPTVEADGAMLGVVFANLLSNAVKFTRTREEARIEVGCAGEEQDRAILFVRDNGVGFDMAYREKLFGVFQRLHGQEEFEGTGIGLANVRRVIERHGGRIWAESTLHEGACFYFTLTRVRAAAATTTSL